MDKDSGGVKPAVFSYTRAGIVPMPRYRNPCYKSVATRVKRKTKERVPALHSRSDALIGLHRHRRLQQSSHVYAIRFVLHTSGHLGHVHPNNSFKRTAAERFALTCRSLRRQPLNSER